MSIASVAYLEVEVIEKPGKGMLPRSLQDERQVESVSLGEGR